MHKDLLWDHFKQIFQSCTARAVFACGENPVMMLTPAQIHSNTSLQGEASSQKEQEAFSLCQKLPFQGQGHLRLGHNPSLPAECFPGDPRCYVNAEFYCCGHWKRLTTPAGKGFEVKPPSPPLISDQKPQPCLPHPAPAGGPCQGRPDGRATMGPAPRALPALADTCCG